MEKVEIFIHMVCALHTNLLQSIWCFTMNHKQFRTSTAFWNTSILVILSHSSMKEFSNHTLHNTLDSQKSYRKTSAMVCLKEMVESSSPKKPLFFPKSHCFFFWFCFLSGSNMGKKKRGKREEENISLIYFFTAHKFNLPLNITSHAQQQVINPIL